METWRNLPITGLEQYQVSDEGCVRNLSYKDTGRIRYLSPVADKDGYSIVCLTSRFGKQNSYRVHRLVALAFLPEQPGKPCINHKNECKEDNRACNLEWVTYRENNNYGTRNERMSRAKINGNSKRVLQLTFEGVIVKEWPSISEIKRVFGYDTGLISKCCKGKKKTAYGSVWQYAV